MKTISYEERQLMAVYDPGTRLGLVQELKEMRKFLEPDETQLLSLTDNAISHLETMTDAEYAALDLFPDFT